MDARITVLTLPLAPGLEHIPLNVILVQWPEGALIVDTAEHRLLPAILAFLAQNAVGPGALRLIVNTHFHSDHVGCNADLTRQFGALVAAPLADAREIEDVELALRRIWQPLSPGDPGTEEIDQRASPVHIRFAAPFTLSLGGGVLLDALPLPGHTAGSIGLYERSTATLLLGDAILADTLPEFHVLENGVDYRRSLLSLQEFAGRRPVQQASTAHHLPMSGAELMQLIAGALDSSDRVAAASRALRRDGNLEETAHALSRRFGKLDNGTARIAAYAYTRDVWPGID